MSAQNARTDRPSKGTDEDTSRTEQARRVVEEYVNDLREIIKTLRRHLN